MSESFSARCPVCGNEWDFATRRAADVAARSWRQTIIGLFTRALRRGLML